jgi:hypothetical protein
VSFLSTSAIASSLATIGVLVLITLLVLKELTIASANSRLHRVSRALNFGILPLLIAFFLIVIFQVIEVLH